MVSRHNAPGFSKPLEFDVYYNESLEDILDRLNQYRSPDAQIKTLYNQFGQQVPVSLNLRRDTTLYLEKNLKDSSSPFNLYIEIKFNNNNNNNNNGEK